MSKKALFLITIIAAVSLSACSHTPVATVDDTEAKTTTSSVSTESTAPEETDSIAEGTSSFEPVNETSAPVSEASKPPATASETPNEHHAEVSQPPKTESSAEPATQPPQPPVVPTQPPVTPEPEPTPEPSKPPVTPEPQPTEPAFDVSRYVSYAKNYGTGIGLTLDSAAVACWDTPTEAHAGCLYLERDLKDLLDWYKASGFTEFWVWSEDTGNGNYLIYVGYA